MQSFNPFTEKVIKSYPDYSDAEMGNRVRAAQSAFRDWKQLGFEERSSCMMKMSEILLERKSELGRIITEEMGKPISESMLEIEKCASACEYYARQASGFLEPELIETEASKSYVSFQPLGVVLAIMPWNFPFWQVFRFAVPAMMAGNAVLLKHAPNVPGCAQAIEELFVQAGFNESLLTNLFISTDQVSSLIEDPIVTAVTLTGSTRAGKAVAAKAGACLKKSVLELGGSDPYIILEDADLDKAVDTCVASKLINNGQTCISAKRFIVVEEVKSQFEKMMAERMSAYEMGDPGTGITQVMVASQKARVGFTAITEVRNKVIEAYRDV
ncbi:MAG: aldehyde dehydrogenase family protein, partial [Chloroflexota bacterium]